jgi:hypothetical protein
LISGGPTFFEFARLLANHVGGPRDAIVEDGIAGPKRNARPAKVCAAPHPDPLPALRGEGTILDLSGIIPYTPSQK